eukprot:jgi/Mesvir1/22437/Mv17910-RA.1
MPLEVIGAGFGRTGTLSLKGALNLLGFGPCYHMMEVIKNGDIQKWIDVADTIDRKGRDYDFEQIFSAPDGREPFRSTVDFPSTSFYKELLKQYPGAKVILTVRDSAEKWYQSVVETIAGSHGRYYWPLNMLNSKFQQMVHATVWDKKIVFDRKFHTKDGAAHAQEIYLRWIEEVKRVVPAEQLLVFNVKEGWEPLCKFLQVPVPDVPFPCLNDRAEFKARFMSKPKPGDTKPTLVYVGIGLAAVMMAAGLARLAVTRSS